jgi:hypothetical protein
MRKNGTRISIADMKKNGMEQGQVQKASRCVGGWNKDK